MSNWEELSGRERPCLLLLDCLSFLTETDVKVRPAGRSGALEDASAPREEEEEEDVLEETNMLLSVLEGFLMVLSTKGDVIFLSENVSQHMGLTQVQHPQTRVFLCGGTFGPG